MTASAHIPPPEHDRLRFEDIQVGSVDGEAPPGFQVLRARLRLTVEHSFDAHPDREIDARKHLEKYLRTHLATRIYGDVRVKAREAYETIKRLGFTPVTGWENYQAMLAAIEPLLNYGQEMISKGAGEDEASTLPEP